MGNSNLALWVARALSTLFVLFMVFDVAINCFGYRSSTRR